MYVCMHALIRVALDLASNHARQGRTPGALGGCGNTGSSGHSCFTHGTYMHTLWARKHTCQAAPPELLVAMDNPEAEASTCCTYMYSPSACQRTCQAVPPELLAATENPEAQAILLLCVAYTCTHLGHANRHVRLHPQSYWRLRKTMKLRPMKL